MIKRIKGAFKRWLETGIPAKDAHLYEDDVIDTSPMQYRTKSTRGRMMARSENEVFVFEGPNGTFSVYQDFEDLTIWTVEQIHHDAEDTSAGHFMSKANAIHAARKWAGEPEEPTHPVPNRRAAIAHSRAKA
jgi:hypothetical protein